MKRDFTHLDQYRTTDGEFASPDGATYGAFAIPHYSNKGERFPVICDDGTGPEQSGWEHVSVRLVVDPELRICRCPTWYEMDWIKSLYWEDNEVVVQYHVNDERKIQHHRSVLHLWRPVDGKFPMPPGNLV